jgi:uncharacterized protein (TIGR02598 family)
MTLRHFTRGRIAAFSLVEVCLSVGVASFCLASLVAMLPVGIMSNRTSISETAAVSLASVVIADLENMAPSASQNAAQNEIHSPLFQIPFSTINPESHTLYFKDHAQPAGDVDADAQPSEQPQYRVTLNFIPPENGGESINTNPEATKVRVLVTWPAMADRSAQSAPSKYSGSYETVISLNLN